MMVEMCIYIHALNCSIGAVAYLHSIPSSDLLSGDGHVACKVARKRRRGANNVRQEQKRAGRRGAERRTRAAIYVAFGMRGSAMWCIRVQPPTKHAWVRFGALRWLNEGNKVQLHYMLPRFFINDLQKHSKHKRSNP